MSRYPNETPSSSDPESGFTSAASTFKLSRRRKSSIKIPHQEVPVNVESLYVSTTPASPFDIFPLRRSSTTLPQEINYETWAGRRRSSARMPHALSFERLPESRRASIEVPQEIDYEGLAELLLRANTIAGEEPRLVIPEFKALGASDQFAVAVSLLCSFVLMLVFAAKIARAAKNKLQQFKKRSADAAAAADAAVDNEGDDDVRVMYSQNQAVAGTAAEAGAGNEGAEPMGDPRSFEDLQGPQGPEGPYVEDWEAADYEPDSHYNADLLDRPVRIQRKLLASNPRLKKEHKKLRRMEEALRRLEWEAERQAAVLGPGEFILGVISRVLDVQPLGRESDA